MSFTFNLREPQWGRYLHLTSQHPGHIKRNVTFNLVKRLVRIVYNSDTLSYHLEELKEFLLKRKYPDKSQVALTI